MNKQEYNQKIRNYQQEIENALDRFLWVPDCAQAQVIEAMRYALLGGGKRMRAILLLEFAKGFGVLPEDALVFACAAEMIHAYSLVHDDLPCMDDDDLRRGKPSCHKQFSESTALLAGDALLTKSFYLMSFAPENSRISAENRLKTANIFAVWSGEFGMIGGQTIDCDASQIPKDLDDLFVMYLLKTGALIKACCSAGCVLSGKEEYLPKVEEYAYYFGLAFQIVDDILDVTGDESLLGKPIGSDAQNQKHTSVSFLGTEKAREKAGKYTQKATEILRDLPFDTQFLQMFTSQMLDRLQ